MPWKRIGRQHGAASPGLDPEETATAEVAPPDPGPGRFGASGISSVSAVSPGGIGVSPVVTDPAASTPLETGVSGGGIPNAARWAMKDRSHFHRRRDTPDGEPINECLGSGTSALYVVDDGPDHCMISRLVGQSPDGCLYCLVGRISLYEVEQLGDGDAPLVEAFSDARDICLCGVFEDEGASNVIIVAHYRRADAVPDEYLPPGPFLEFSEPVLSEE